MRILHLTADWHHTGGVSSYVRLVAPVLAAAGHEVLVIHAGDATTEGVTDRLAVQAFPASLRPGSDEARFVPGVMQAVADFAPDIAHFHASNNFAIENAVRAQVPTLKTMHTLGFCPAGTKYHAATGTPCTFTTGLMCVPRQGYLRCTMSKRPTIWWRNYTHAARANEHHQTYGQLIVTSQYVRQQAMASGFDGARIAVVPYFTTLPAEVTPVTTRSVLYIGRLAREKGADLVLEAMALVPGDWRVGIVGDGIDMAYVRARAAALGIAARVDFKGWMTGAALEEEYRQAAVVVVPSRLPEPFGITGIESMAWQRPVVAFDVGGIPEWLDNGVGGYRVPAGDVRLMASRIADILSDPAGADQIAALGRSRVERDFTAAPHLRQLLPLYARVIAHGI